MTYLHELARYVGFGGEINDKLFLIKDLWRAELFWLEALLPQRECLEYKSPPAMNE